MGLMKNKYCCKKKMQEVSYALGEGEELTYYQCKENIEHRKFGSKLEEMLITRNVKIK